MSVLEMISGFWPANASLFQGNRSQMRDYWNMSQQISRLTRFWGAIQVRTQHSLCVNRRQGGWALWDIWQLFKFWRSPTNLNVSFSYRDFFKNQNTNREDCSIEGPILTLSLKCPLVLASMFVRQQAFCFLLGYFQYFRKKVSILRIATGTQQQQEVGIQQRKPEGRQADRRQGLSHSPPAPDVYWFIWLGENKF